MSVEPKVSEPAVSEVEITATSNPKPASIPSSSALGVVRSDLDRRIRSANDAARLLLGMPDIEGKTLDDVFKSPEARNVLKQQLAKRSEGRFGSYDVELTRLDGKRVPVEIIGIPLKGEDGIVTGSLGIFRSRVRDELAAKIHQLNREIDDPTVKLNRLVKLLKPVFNFDAMSVSRYSDDFRHLKTFFIHGREAPAKAEQRWWPINDAQEKWLRAVGTRIIPNIVEFLDSGPWQDARDRPEVKKFIADGFKGLLRKDVRKDGRLVGSIAFMSKRADNFNEADCAILEDLPLEHVVLRAMEWSDRVTLQRRLALASGLNLCTTIPEACKEFASGVMALFSWAHVSVFRVDEVTRHLHAIALANHEGARILDFSHLPPQPLSLGVVGRAVRLERTENVPDVSVDPDYKAVSEDVHSELCVPIRFVRKGPVRFAVNAEDGNKGAFSTVEQREMEELAEQFGAVLFQISELQSLAAAFENASDPIFIIDAQRRVRRYNPAAVNLIGGPVKVGVLLDDLMDDGEAFAAAVEKDGEELGEMEITASEEGRTFTIPVYVSRRTLPDGNGAVVVARDLTSIRRAVELEVLSQSAYDIAVETSTALSIATAQIEAIMKREGQDDVDVWGLDRALRQLRRVRDSYLRLAGSTTDVLPGADDLVELDLAEEVKALVNDFPTDYRDKILPQYDPTPSRVWASPFAIRTALESVMGPLLRCATDRGRISVTTRNVDEGAVLVIQGRLPVGGDDEAVRVADYERGAMQVGETYLERVMDAMGASVSPEPSSDGGMSYVFRFPGRPS